MTAPLTAVSLFAGVGGFELALSRAGIHTVASVEIDDPARGVVTTHFPDTTTFADIREVTGAQLIAAGFDPVRGIITAGWPCQGNSIAGRRAGMADPRSGLWSHVVRLLAELRPTWFLGENVPGLLSVNRGQDWATVVGDLADLGMGFCWRVLDAQHFGVPQRRSRVFVVGHSGADERSPVRVLLEPEGGGGDPAQGGPSRAADSVASTLRASGGGAADNDARANRLLAFPLMSHHGRNSHDEETLTVAYALRRDPGGTGQAHDASEDGTGRGSPIIGNGTVVRQLTPTEKERLQGYPDGWTATSASKPQSDSARSRQLGNSVAVPVVEWIARRIVKVDGD